MGNHIEARLLTQTPKSSISKVHIGLPNFTTQALSTTGLAGQCRTFHGID
jgi:hypothetical protein